MGADHTAAGEMLAVAADDLRKRRREEFPDLPDSFHTGNRLAATVEAALTFHPDREVERIPERLPAIGDALAAFRAAREGGNQ